MHKKTEPDMEINGGKKRGSGKQQSEAFELKRDCKKSEGNKPRH
jgi:hypothetical protein